LPTREELLRQTPDAITWVALEQPTLGGAWEEIDFDQRIVTIQSSDTKTGARRRIPMKDMLHRTLEEVRIKSPGPVFPNRKGTPYYHFRTPIKNVLRKIDSESSKYLILNLAPLAQMDRAPDF